MALTVQPFADSKELDRVREALNVNVGEVERIGSVAAGAGLVLYGLSRRSIPPLQRLLHVRAARVHDLAQLLQNWLREWR